MPTLIVQGVADEYGDRAAAQAYPLSPAVTLRFVPGNHNFSLSPQGWARIARLVLGFCSAVTRRAAPAGRRLTIP